MNKKIILVSIFVVLMFATMSLVSAINSIAVSTEEKESPLYKFRAERAYAPSGETRNLRDSIRSIFLEENRIYFVSVINSYQEPSVRDLLNGPKIGWMPTILNTFCFGICTWHHTSRICCEPTLAWCTEGESTCNFPRC